ncbi:ComF family protein [Vibrio sp. SS-MA-C1-2]|uniref:ComF family protein n=1 Tax=Vibrio sp. SS-MA-C1-2 TaxID=2908646 RepID=UPI001F44CC03|nr:phosphoribosyltransferase family protein [Vibrio sp. SS-MA-C1-2]UJF19287.1 ComF family protein [Vibrio sp. SS-MA-C1-2]
MKIAVYRLFSPYCLLCQSELTIKERDLCHYCLNLLPDHPRCLCCGLPLPSNQEKCGECLRSPPLWQKLSCIGDYTFPLDKLIQQFKYQKQFILAPSLAELLIPWIQEKPQALLPVPMHWQRQLLRGFNQSELLTLEIGKRINRPTLCHHLIRARKTTPQQGLSSKERRKNLHQAFELVKEINYQHIAIIDDVVTTGTTINEMINLLKNKGIARIDVICLCRTAK